MISKLKSFIEYHAYKICKRYPRSMERSDAENILWESLIKNLHKYDPTITDLASFARTLVYRRCMNHLTVNRNLKNHFYEHCVDLWNADQTEIPDIADTVATRRYNTDTTKTHNKIILDCIEHDLYQEAIGKRRDMMKTALHVFKLFRKGWSGYEIANRLDISVGYVYRLKKIIKNISSKYK